MDNDKDNDEELNKLDEENKKLRMEKSTLQSENQQLKEEIERLKRERNLPGQNEDTKKMHKNPQDQQEEKISENEECLPEENKSANKEENVPAVGPSISPIVATSIDSQKPFRKKKRRNKTRRKANTQSIPIDESRESNIKCTLNTKLEMIENDQIGSQFATYKKRKGTGNEGKEYEYLMCAYYALKFSLDKNVVDFKITTNNEKFGDFDDAELTVTFSDKSTHSFLMQLKHSVEEKGITEKMLVESRDFNLIKYFKSFKTLRLSELENITCILLTNRKSQLEYSSNFLFSHEDIKGAVTVKPYQPKNTNHLLVNTPEGTEESCFQFELSSNQDNSKDVKEFFQNFCLLTNQSNIKGIQLFITKTLNKLFGCSIDFVSFMQYWWTKNFVLTRHDVITKLAELALTPYIQEIPVKNDKPLSKKSKILKSAIEKFDMTLVAECDKHKVTQMWSESLAETEIDTINKASLKYGLSIKEEMSPIDQSKVLWYLNKVPIIIKYEEDAKVRILGAVRLLEDEQKKIILLDNLSKEEFKNWKIFENLFDLRNEELYKEIIKTFKVSLQGRTSISLEQLLKVDIEIAKDIKTKELFQMLEEDLLIGKPLHDLPEAYIPRTIATLFLNTKQVLNYYISSQNDLLIFICDEKIEDVIISKITKHQMSHNNNFLGPNSLLFQNREKRTKSNILEIIQFDDDFLQKPFCPSQDSKPLLLWPNKNFSRKQFEKICQRNSQLNIYLLQIINEECCAIVSGQGNLSQLAEMILSSNLQIREDKLFSVFRSPLNVITGKPGIGKSTLFTFLSRQCPPDCWCILINLIKLNQLFKEKLDYDAILDKMLKKEEQVFHKILDKFITSKRMYLLLDGLDEISSEYIEDVLKFVKYISDTGIKVWVSSRENLKDKISLQLNVAPIEIQELTELEQKKYIRKRLLSAPTLNKKYDENEVENIITKIFKNLSINYNAKRLLGIPLQLYIITEIFRRKRQAIEIGEDFFVLSKIFQLFFDGKYKQQQAKACSIKEAFDDDLDAILKQYELPALRACLDDKTFNKLKLRNNELEECRTFLEKIKCKGNKLGIISQVVDEGQKLEAIFCHQSFAEYFACRWLQHNSDKLRLIKNDFFEDKYQNLRLIFDIMLAEDKPLHLATVYKSLDQVKKYKEQCNEKDKGGRSALHIICSYSEIVTVSARNENESLQIMEIVKLLVHNCNPSKKDSLFNWDCLEYALRSKTLLPFEIILKTGKHNINIDGLFKHFKEDELVDLCSRFCCSHLLTAIVKERSEIKNKMSGDLIWEAVGRCMLSKVEYFRNQYIETIKILADAGCNLNQRENSYNGTPLHYACRFGSCDIVETLLEKGADINAVTIENLTMLDLASMNNKPEIIEYLIEKRMQVNRVDIYNRTPLHWACAYSTRDVVNILLTNGADINAVTDENETMLHYASFNKPEIIEFLIKNGMHVNQVEINNKTPLHFACEQGTCETIQTLLKNGADINAVTNKNHTMLHYASINDKPEIIEYLIKKRMQVNQVDVCNGTPLHLACRYSTREVVNILLKNGADINAVTNENQTMLHLASMNNKPEIIEYLIKKRMQVNRVDVYNRTPLHLALRYGTREVVNILLKNGAVTNDN